MYQFSGFRLNRIMLPIDSCIVLASVLLAITAQEWTKINCPAPRSPTNGMSFIFENGQRVQFHCHPGFQMVGKNLAECKRNRWSSPPPRCIPLNANQDPSAGSDDVTSPYSRSVFNWQQRQTEETEQPMSISYGASSNRLPLINGLWGYPAQPNSRVLAIVPDSHYGNSIKAKDLVEQEMNIAALRHQLEQEVKSSRHIEPRKEDPTVSPYYSPYKINSDGYLVGIGGINDHPVYYLGASADHKVDEYYKNTRIGPELAELRRKQIEEARNIQMNAANNRQRNRFQNTLTYGTKDIPVWKGRQPSGRYWSEETVYKPARVEMTKYAEQNRFFVHNPSNAHLIPKPIPIQTQRSLISTTERPLLAQREFITTSTARDQSHVQNILTQMDMKSTRMPSTMVTSETIIANIPTPPVLSEPVASSLTRKKQTKTELSLLKNETVSTARNQSSVVNVSKKNYDDFEWPPEALWFKYPTSKRPSVVTTHSLRRWPTRRTSKGSKSRGRRVNKKNNKKPIEERPQVTHFSHGRVKSTEPKASRRFKS